MIGKKKDFKIGKWHNYIIFEFGKLWKPNQDHVFYPAHTRIMFTPISIFWSGRNTEVGPLRSVEISMTFPFLMIFFSGVKNPYDYNKEKSNNEEE